MAKKLNFKNPLLIIAIIVALFFVAKGTNFLGTVTPSAYVSRHIAISGNQATITYTYGGVSDKWGGVLTEHIPIEYTVRYDLLQAYGYKKSTTATESIVEIPFTSSSSPIVYIDLPITNPNKYISGQFQFAESGPSGNIVGDTKLFSCTKPPITESTCPGKCYWPVIDAGGCTQIDQCNELGKYYLQGTCSAQDGITRLCCAESPTVCSDGTAYHQCSTTKPKYCEVTGDNMMYLANKCSVCGCPNPNDVCNADGTCTCTPACVRPANKCTPASQVSNGCGGFCDGAWTVVQNTLADTDCNNKVSDAELISFIGKWMQGQYTTAQLLTIITAWAQS